jgi:NTE family protein
MIVAGCALALACATALAQEVAPAPTPVATGRPRIGLVLSGGGARGFAHIGVLKVLNELNVPVDVITATSMGSIVGGAYASGRTPAYLEKLVADTNWDEMFAGRPPRADLPFRRKEDDYKNLFSFEFGVSRDGPTLPRGIVSTQNLYLMLQALTAHVDDVKDFNQLPIPFAAMATNLATGQLTVLQKDVPLATAMRASMSVPGAFAPVDVQGQPLVDGGLVRNLPIDIARRMGVDVVIAINVGTPLLPREKLDTVLGVGEQMINILTEQNVGRSLAELRTGDILITPALEKFSASDFQRGRDIIAVGEQAARDVAQHLKRLAVSSEDYARFEERRIGMAARSVPVTIHEVKVEGLKKVNPEAVRVELDVPTDRPVDNTELARAAQRVFATADFETVNYSLVETDGRRRLTITPYEKSWGYNTLRLGGAIQTDFDSINSFDLLAAHTWRWLNSWGAEWRNEIQIGDEQRLLTEWYQPLSPGSRWFVLPRLRFDRQQRDLFVGEARIARQRNSVRAADVQFGLALPRLGSVRVGAGRYKFNGSVQVGLPLPEQEADANGLSVGLNLDTLDTVNYPRKGYFLDFEAVTFHDISGTRERDNFSAAELLFPFTFGRYTIAASARFGTATQVNAFQLGGLFNLSGTPVGQIAGSTVALLRLNGYRNISDAFGDLSVPIYVGFSFEAGDAVDRDVSLSWSRAKQAASLYVGTDSTFGPLYLAVGRTAGGSTAGYLFWGRPR